MFEFENRFKCIGVIFIALVIVGLSLSIPKESIGSPKSENDATDFRKAKWGISKDEVKRLEKIEIIAESEEVLGYLGEVAGLKTLVIFEFGEDKLVSGYYFIEEKHTAKMNYIIDHNRIRELLIKKYGPPIHEYEKWIDNFYKDRRDKWGQAISEGHLMLGAEWETETTKIVIVLSGDNFELKNTIKYLSKAFAPLIDKKEQEEALDGL